MAVKLNHTIVHARDRQQSAAFFAEVFGLPAPRPFGRSSTSTSPTR